MAPQLNFIDAKAHGARQFLLRPPPGFFRPGIEKEDSFFVLHFVLGILDSDSGWLHDSPPMQVRLDPRDASRAYDRITQSRCHGSTNDRGAERGANGWIKFRHRKPLTKQQQSINEVIHDLTLAHKP